MGHRRGDGAFGDAVIDDRHPRLRLAVAGEAFGIQPLAGRRPFDVFIFGGQPFLPARIEQGAADGGGGGIIGINLGSDIDAMAAGAVDSPAIPRGIDYLLRTQGSDGFWAEERYTATGFPRVFYLRYHGYAKFFPLWALARYRNITQQRYAKFGM